MYNFLFFSFVLGCIYIYMTDKCVTAQTVAEPFELFRGTVFLIKYPSKFCTQFKKKIKIRFFFTFFTSSVPLLVCGNCQFLVSNKNCALLITTFITDVCLWDFWNLHKHMICMLKHNANDPPPYLSAPLISTITTLYKFTILMSSMQISLCHLDNVNICSAARKFLNPLWFSVFLHEFVIRSSSKS